MSLCPFPCFHLPYLIFFFSLSLFLFFSLLTFLRSIEFWFLCHSLQFNYMFHSPQSSPYFFPLPFCLSVFYLPFYSFIHIFLLCWYLRICSQGTDTIAFQGFLSSLLIFLCFSVLPFQKKKRWCEKNGLYISRNERNKIDLKIRWKSFPMKS